MAENQNITNNDLQTSQTTNKIRYLKCNYCTEYTINQCGRNLYGNMGDKMSGTCSLLYLIYGILNGQFRCGKAYIALRWKINQTFTHPEIKLPCRAQTPNKELQASNATAFIYSDIGKSKNV